MIKLNFSKIYQVEVDGERKIVPVLGRQKPSSLRYSKIFKADVVSDVSVVEVLRESRELRQVERSRDGQSESEKGNGKNVLKKF